jgi:hypothetical protein
MYEPVYDSFQLITARVVVALQRLVQQVQDDAAMYDMLRERGLIQLLEFLNKAFHLLLVLREREADQRRAIEVARVL